MRDRGGAMADGAHEREQTPRAAQAFRDYVALPERSLAKLRDQYVAQGRTGRPSSILRQLQEWSSEYGWQKRIEVAATAQATADLDLANDIRRRIYLRSLREYERRTEDAMIQAMQLSDIHPIHDRAKPPDPHAGALTLTGTLTVVIGERPDGPQ